MPEFELTSTFGHIVEAEDEEEAREKGIELFENWFAGNKPVFEVEEVKPSPYQIEIWDRSKHGLFDHSYSHEIVIITEDGSLGLALASSFDVARVLKEALENHDLDNIVLTDPVEPTQEKEESSPLLRSPLPKSAEALGRMIEDRTSDPLREV